MNRDSRNPEPHSLAWSAFCYIADEMTDDEKSRFEFRLQDDELAQQAVVDAIQQTQIIASTQSIASNQKSPPVTVSRQDSRPAPNRLPVRIGALVAMAASVCLVIFGWNMFTGPNTAMNPSTISPSTPSTRSDDPNFLAVTWANTRFDTDDDDLEDSLCDDAPTEYVVLDYADQEDPADVFAPDEESENWMFVALVDQSNTTEGLE